MSLESTAVGITKDAVNKGVNFIETTIKKAWSLLDAASEKKSPSEILGKKGLSSIQGKIDNS